MRFRRLAFAGTILAALAVPGAVAVTASPAGAVANQICDGSSQQPAGDCFNEWGGGAYVKSYTPNVSNDNFHTQAIAGRCQAGSVFTTANCPISGVPAGLVIVQFVYQNTGKCVGDLGNNSGDAHASGSVTCNDPGTGFGGGYGTVHVGTSCTDNTFTAFANAHWSSNWTSGVRYTGYSPKGSTGQQFWLNQAGGDSQSLCWAVFLAWGYPEPDRNHDVPVPAGPAWQRPRIVWRMRGLRCP
jgi:hypothetical protein